MNQKLLPAIIVVGVFALGFGLSGFFIAKEIYQTEAPMGSVNIGQQYQATTTAEMSGTLVKAAEFNQLIASSTHGTVILGSVIVASTTAHAMNIYNATSTGAVADGTYGTFITRLSSSTPRGTYIYDIEMNVGLVVQLQAGFAGDYVFSWKK